MIWALSRRFTDPLFASLGVWFGGHPSLVAMDTMCLSLSYVLGTSILQGTNTQPHYFIVQFSTLKVT